MLWVQSCFLALPFFGDSHSALGGREPRRTPSVVYTIDGLPVTVYEKDVSNPILLHIPGNGGWNYLSEEMAGNLGMLDIFTLATYQMRGMQPGSTPPTTWDAHVQDVISITRYLMRRYKAETICVMGYSTGTYVANEAANALPRYYRAVVDMGLIPDLSTDKSQKVLTQKYQENLHMPSWLSKVVKYVDYTPLYIQLGTANELKQNGDISRLFSTPMRYLGPTDLAESGAFSKSMASLPLPDIHLDALRLQCPLHIIQGDRDTMGLQEVIAEQVDAIRAPSKTIHWIRGAGHTPHVTHMEEVRAALREVRRSLS